MQVSAEFHGVFPYLVSPISPSGEVLAPVLSRLCDDLIGAGVHGLTALGSTGEFAYLDWAQRRRVVETVVAAAAGRVPVSPGSRPPRPPRRSGRRASSRRSAATASSPCSRPTSPSPTRGSRPISAPLPRPWALPVVIYTNPNFQRADLSLPVIERLSEVANIVGIKDASSNTGRLLSILNRVEGRMQVFAASAHIPAAVMLIGGSGWMAGPACIVPRQSVALYEACRRGDWDAAMELQRRLWGINEAFAKYNLAACIKGALELQGYPVGAPLPPQAPLPPAGIEEVRRALADLGAL